MYIYIPVYIYIHTYIFSHMHTYTIKRFKAVYKNAVGENSGYPRRQCSVGPAGKLFFWLCPPSPFPLVSSPVKVHLLLWHRKRSLCNLNTEASFPLVQAMPDPSPEWGERAGERKKALGGHSCTGWEWDLISPLCPGLHRLRQCGPHRC